MQSLIWCQSEQQASFIGIIYVSSGGSSDSPLLPFILKTMCMKRSRTTAESPLGPFNVEKSLFTVLLKQDDQTPSLCPWIYLNLIQKATERWLIERPVKMVLVPLG